MFSNKLKQLNFFLLVFEKDCEWSNLNGENVCIRFAHFGSLENKVKAIQVDGLSAAILFLYGDTITKKKHKSSKKKKSISIKRLNTDLFLSDCKNSNNAWRKENVLHLIQHHSKPNGLFGEVSHNHVTPTIKLWRKKNTD